MSSSWQLLDVDDENQLHKSRLFSIEEKPFKRITKRLGAINDLTNSKVRQALTPPPESNGAQAAPTAPKDAPALDLAQLKEDITFDFAAFDGTIARLQFLLSANEKQREKYAAERVQILETCQGVRDNTSQLRGQLDQARATLAQRKKFDKLAEKISNNKLLRVRSEQEANLLKLEDECRQLEAESETYAGTWLERKEQFARIMDESMRLRSIIRDEKEEVERREGMDDEGGGDGGAGDVEAEASQTPRPGIASGNATPRPDSGAPSAVPRGLESGDGSGTPAAASASERTPGRDSPAPSGQEGLKPRPDASGSFSQNGSRGPSRDGSPARETEEGEDVVMDESVRPVDTPVEGTQGEDTPRITVEGQEVVEDKMDTT